MITDNINTQNGSVTPTRDLVFEDFKVSVVIISLFVNLTVFVTWLTTIA